MFRMCALSLLTIIACGKPPTDDPYLYLTNGSGELGAITRPLLDKVSDLIGCNTASWEHGIKAVKVTQDDVRPESQDAIGFYWEPSTGPQIYVPTDQGEWWHCIHHVFLHEVGHALGLKHSTDQFSVMWPRCNDNLITVTDAVYSLANELEHARFCKNKAANTVPSPF